MESIETCVNQEPNASPSVLTVEAITKAPVSVLALDVREANDSQPRKVKGNNFVALQNLKAQKFMVALCLQEGKEIIITYYKRT